VGCPECPRLNPRNLDALVRSVHRGFIHGIGSLCAIQPRFPIPIVLSRALTGTLSKMSIPAGSRGASTGAVSCAALEWPAAIGRLRPARLPFNVYPALHLLLECALPHQPPNANTLIYVSIKPHSSEGVNLCLSTGVICTGHARPLPKEMLPLVQVSRRTAFVESPGGVSPPGAPRTVHDPLESHGSRCPAVSMT
jgi:hypothetical protein